MRSVSLQACGGRSNDERGGAPGSRPPVTTSGAPAPAQDPEGDDPARAVPRRVVGSGELFQGRGELIILHRNEEYRLRITRAGKLILTK